LETEDSGRHRGRQTGKLRVKETEGKTLRR
jgi:hypothetical protein